MKHRLWPAGSPMEGAWREIPAADWIDTPDGEAVTVCWPFWAESNAPIVGWASTSCRPFSARMKAWVWSTPWECVALPSVALPTTPLAP